MSASDPLCPLLSDGPWVLDLDAATNLTKQRIPATKRRIAAAPAARAAALTAPPTLRVHGSLPPDDRSADSSPASAQSPHPPPCATVCAGRRGFPAAWAADPWAPGRHRCRAHAAPRACRCCHLAVRADRGHCCAGRPPRFPERTGRRRSPGGRPLSRRRCAHAMTRTGCGRSGAPGCRQ